MISVLEIISLAVNVVLGLMTIYLYFENRKLRGFEIDNKIELKEIERELTTRRHLEEMKKLWENYSGGDLMKIICDQGPLLERQQREIDSVDAEINHLKKLQRYKWIFSK